jgi:micrococcal nuclease
MDNYIRKATVINVVDGDTIDAVVDLGYAMTTVQRFRLLSINTPERGEAGFTEAKDFVKDMILGKTVYIQSEKSDSFGRYLANVYVVDGEFTYSLNDLLLSKGLAVPFKK